MSYDEALSIWSEAAQDLSSAGLAQATGAHFNCADLCNQVAEKALQAVYVLEHGHRASYDHHLRPLGELVGAPEEVLADLDALTPYFPETFYAHTPPDLADDAIDGETVAELVQRARRVLRWARGPVMRGGWQAPG
ncbi:MAG TPA: HEPN domain-containing protein [Ktedonobacterales bacterium]|jgi:HEPN domain-containing protein